jgi:hypothetical protein
VIQLIFSFGLCFGNEKLVHSELDIISALVFKFIQYSSLAEGEQQEINLIISSKDLKDVISQKIALKNNGYVITELALFGKLTEEKRKVVIIDQCPEKLTNDFLSRAANTLMIHYGQGNCLEKTHIDLFLENQKFKFNINLINLNKSSVKLDSRLLALAKEVIK